MVKTCVGFVDVGFLRASGADAMRQNRASIRPNGRAVVEWFRRFVSAELESHKFLRAYWYDGAFDPSHSEYAGQRAFFDAIARTPGIQLRLGQLVERPHPSERQIRDALRRTAADLELESTQLLDAFNRRWTFRPVRQQKGVDTLIALDLVRLAQRPVYDTAVLVAGDRDLAEAVRTAQDFGARVMVATPRRQGVAQEVVQLADGIVDIGVDDLRLMLPPRPARTD